MAPTVVASWEQVDIELERVEGAMKRLELAIPERIPGSMRFGVACRIGGMVESIHASIDLVREWAERAKRMT